MLAVAAAAGCNNDADGGLGSLSGGSLGSTAPGTSTAETGEETGSGSGESVGPDVPPQGEMAAFRITQLTLVDPHVYAQLVSMDPEPPCIDGTTYLNDTLLAQSIADGSIDIVAVFPNLDIEASEVDVSLRPAECEPAAAPTMCTDLDPPAGALETTADNIQSGECYLPDPATLGVGYDTPNSPTGPCFTSVPGELTLPLPGVGGGTQVVLQDVQFSATYQEGALVVGVLVGFATQSEAEITVLDDGMVVQGGATLWQLVAGGDSCETTIDDTDMHPEHGNGVWIYFDFAATAITWTG